MKLLSLTSSSFPPKKGAECLSSGDFFFRRYDDLMLQYIETYEGTGSKQNIRPRRFSNFEKTSFCVLNLIEIHSLKYELVSPWHHVISWLP